LATGRDECGDVAGTGEAPPDFDLVQSLILPPVPAGVLGPQRVLAGLSFQSGDLEAPGKVSHTNNGETYLGELDRSRTERLEKIRGLMEEAGLNPVIVDDVVSTIWAKFVHNCGINALCAISGHNRRQSSFGKTRANVNCATFSGAERHYLSCEPTGRRRP
jgi:hypothetical protein